MDDEKVPKSLVVPILEQALDRWTLLRDAPYSSRVDRVSANVHLTYLQAMYKAETGEFYESSVRVSNMEVAERQMSYYRALFFETWMPDDTDFTPGDFLRKLKAEESARPNMWHHEMMGQPPVITLDNDGGSWDELAEKSGITLRPSSPGDRFDMEKDLQMYWPDVRPEWEERRRDRYDVSAIDFTWHEWGPRDDF